MTTNFLNSSKSVKAWQQIKNNFDMINFGIAAVFDFYINFILSRWNYGEQFVIFHFHIDYFDSSFVRAFVEKFFCCGIFDGADQKVSNVVSFWCSGHERAPFDSSCPENLSEAIFLEFVKTN